MQEEGFDLQLSPSQADSLCRALAMLDRGHSSRFEDELWLAFGDEWWPLRERLVKGGYIRRVGGLRDELTMTERGEGLLARLNGGQRIAS